jgi:2-polyprenyl-6-hydroxyphenyl methylase / 3-demethylubiquinone-9 3-methyltransferase
MAVKNNVDTAEIAKFESLAEFWWDRQGALKTLHDINPLRLGYIDSRVSLYGKMVIDVGCGGGILSKAMASKGAQVTGIDMAPAALEIAKRHAIAAGSEITYEQSSAELFLRKNPGRFDVVTCLELLEHVDDPHSVVNACAQLVKPGGHVIFATIDKNPLAGFLAITGGEYVLRLLEKGTHQYARFIKHRDLKRWAISSGLHFRDLTWMRYHPFTGRYQLGRRGVMNYLIHFSRGNS